MLAFYQQHFSGIMTGAFLWDIAMAALIVFAVILGRRCNAFYAVTRGQSISAPPFLLTADLTTPFSAVAAAMFLMSQAIGGAASVIASNGASAAAVRAMDEASHITGHIGTLPLGCLVLCAGLSQIVARYGGRWIGWLGVASGGTLIATTSWGGASLVMAPHHGRGCFAGVPGLDCFLQRFSVAR